MARRIVSSVPVVLVVVDAKAWRASVRGPVVLSTIVVLPEARRVAMLGPCGPHCRAFEGTAGLGARPCGPLMLMLHGTRHGES